MTIPRLTSDVYFVPTSEGVCFLTNRGIEVFTGASIYSWIERLAPHLDGTRTLEELTADLADDKRAMVVDTVSALLARGLAKDVSGRRRDSLQAWERERYAAEIAYLDYFVDSPAWRFQRYRESRFAVVGSGRVFTALTRSVLRSGVRRVVAAVTGESDTDADRLIEQAEADCDARQEFECVPCDGRDDDLSRLVAGADVVLHVSDRPMLGRALRADRQCAQRQTIVVQATVVADEAWIGPISGGPSSWESAWRRLQDHGSAAEFADRPQAAVVGHLAGPAAGVVANQVAITAFRRVTGVEDAAAAPAMRRLDLATLSTTTHRFRPHPLTAPAASVHRAGAAEPAGRAELAARVDVLRGGDRLDPDTFDQRAAALLDSRLGVFCELAEEDFAQVPLNVAMMTVAASGSRVVVTGAGLDFRTARLRAALRAAARYAGACLDLRRTTPGPRGPEVWGYDLSDGSARRIPAAPVFDTGGAAGVSVAAGHDWAEAVSEGLLVHCRALTIAEATAGGPPFPLVDLDALSLDEDATTYRRLLEIAGAAVSVYDVTGSLRVPAYAFCAGPRTVAYACDLQPAVAVRRGLEQALLDHQARANGQPVYAPPAVPDLPPDRRGTSPGRAEAAGLADLGELAAAFTGAGHIPIVVPLDHDPELVSVIPYVVSVVLADD